MKRFSQSGCGIQPRTVESKSRAAILALVFLPLISHAIVDKNSDGISDVWEQQYNSGQLFDPPLDPAADADHDGWTNAQEAASGTNPFDSNPPAGFLRPEVINIPGLWGDPDANGDPVPISPNTLRVSWQTIPGKQYTLLYSPDLTASSWLPVDEAFIGNESINEYNFPLTQPTSTFWRVKIEDTDSDGDALTDAEEYAYGTFSTNPTTVSGIPDLWLAENFASVLMNAGYSYIDPNADPDGDGASNAEEASSGTDPNTSNPATDHHWVRVTGNGEFGEAVTRSGTLTIPAGESRIMIVVIASDEFPKFTGTPSVFNDLLEWNAVPSQGASIQGSIEVNSRHAAWEAAITNDTSLPGFPSPVHIEKISFLTAPPDSALTIQIDVSATNVSDGQLPSHVAVGLIPVEVRDIKDSTNTGDDVTITPWDTATQTNPTDANIAWIEPHKSATDAAPRMPQLELKITGLPATMTIQAKIEVQYNRGNGARAARNQAEDRVRIPADGSFQTVAGDTWRIWEAYASETFFGGAATLTYKLMTGTTETLAPQTIRFRVGGRNPDAARARTHIESLTDCGPTGSLWFAYAIARSESQDYNGSGSRYNQFLRLPQNPRDNGFPLWGNDGGTRPGGYGMFQVTGNVQDSEVNIPRDQIWNWQSNAAAARVIIVDKRRASTNWMTTQSNATHANGTAVPSHTVGNVTFDGTTYTMLHACTIKAYNGASKPSTDTDNATIAGFVVDPSYPSIGHYGYWHSGQDKWGLCRFNNLGFNYVLRVCGEVQP